VSQNEFPSLLSVSGGRRDCPWADCSSSYFRSGLTVYVCALTPTSHCFCHLQRYKILDSHNIAFMPSGWSLNSAKLLAKGNETFTTEKKKNNRNQGIITYRNNG
jgi:hypothetical protein